MNRQLTILYFGTYEEAYPRNRIMLKTLEKMGHVVKECHLSLWANRSDKTGYFSRGRETIMLLLRLLSGYPQLILKYLFAGRYDMVFVGYPGHLDVLIVKILEIVTGRRKKIVFDAFISMYDTIVSDRGMVTAGSALAGCIFRLDRVACSFADVILLDTKAHIEYFSRTFGLPEEKFARVYAGADTSLFHPRKCRETARGFHVLFIGKYTPLHGIDHIVGAAERLRNEKGLQFIFIGKGQLYRPIRELVKEKNLDNIVFIDWVAYEALPDHVQRADICLGIFSKSAKADRVIPNKIFQAMAMGKPVISGRSAAARECLTHGKDVFLCEPGDPAALSAAVLALKSDAALRNRIATGALGTFEADFGGKAATDVLERVLNRAVTM
jgi:glycosyltransferase involved in cell wall biosynthesis